MKNQENNKVEILDICNQFGVNVLTVNYKNNIYYLNDNDYTFEELKNREDLIIEQINIIERIIKQTEEIGEVNFTYEINTLDDIDIEYNNKKYNVDIYNYIKMKDQEILDYEYNISSLQEDNTTVTKAIKDNLIEIIS